MIYGASDGSPLTNLYRVTIPVGVDRSAYIDRCRRTNRVSIKNDSGIQHNVLFPKGGFSDLVFPYSYLSDGNLVAVNRLPATDQLYIVSIYPLEGVVENRPSAGVYMGHTDADGNMSESTLVGGNYRLYSDGVNPSMNFEARGDGASFKASATNRVEVSSTGNTTVRGDKGISLRQNSGGMNINSDCADTKHNKAVQLSVSTVAEDFSSFEGDKKSIKISVKGDNEDISSIILKGDCIEINGFDGKISIKNGAEDLLGVMKEVTKLVDGFITAVQGLTSTPIVPLVMPPPVPPHDNGAAIATQLTTAFTTLSAQLTMLKTLDIPRVNSSLGSLLK